PVLVRRRRAVPADSKRARPGECSPYAFERLEQDVDALAGNGAPDVEDLDRSSVLGAQEPFDLTLGLQLRFTQKNGMNAERRDDQTLRGDQPVPHDLCARRLAIAGDARSLLESAQDAPGHHAERPR